MTRRQDDVKVGDLFDNFGEVWEVTRLRLRGPKEHRSVYEVDVRREERDAFGKGSYVYQRFHVSALQSMRKIETRPEMREAGGAVLIETFTNEEDQTESYVFDNGRGSYNVTMKDLDSGEMMPGGRTDIRDLDQAVALARKWVGLGEAGGLRETDDLPRGPFRPDPYSPRSLRTPDFLHAQPYQGGWILTYRGEHLGTVKKSKTGWRIDAIGGRGRHHDVMERAIELLEAYLAAGGEGGRVLREDARPADVTQAAKEIYDHTDKDRLLRDVERLGWEFVEEHPTSGAWWIQKGNLEIMITFGGPRQQARAFSWRVAGGPSERI